MNATDTMPPRAALHIELAEGHHQLTLKDAAVCAAQMTNFGWCYPDGDISWTIGGFREDSRCLWQIREVVGFLQAFAYALQEKGFPLAWVQRMTPACRYLTLFALDALTEHDLHQLIKPEDAKTVPEG